VDGDNWDLLAENELEKCKKSFFNDAKKLNNIFVDINLQNMYLFIGKNYAKKPCLI
jgi:hypothetical protein